MADVLLVQPIIGLLDRIKDKPAIPLSLITTATNLVKDFQVKVVDQRTDRNWIETLKAKLKNRPICVGTTAMIGPQIKHALQAMKIVKENSDVPTIWGGPQAGIMPEITVKHSLIDYVIQGDGEETFPMLVKSLAAGHAGSRLDSIPGLYYKEQDYHEPFQQVDLNELPDPPYYLVDVKNYLPIRFGRPTIDVETSRGCPFNCSFCYNPFLHKRRWRALPVERISERVLRLWKDYGVESFWFVDDEALVDLDRFSKIIRFMAENSLTWSIQGTTIKNCLRMDNAYLKMLERSGCKQLNIGVESGSERLLEELHKPIRIENVLQVNQRLKGFSIVPSYYFVVGFPTETNKDFNLTLDLIRQLLKENPRAKVMNIGCYTPYPSSELMQTCIERGYKIPETLEEFIHYGVDEINTPWILGNGKILTRIRGANFCNYFLDNKIRDLEIPLHIKIPFGLYRPIARWRFNHKFFRLPLDIHIGNSIRRRIGR